MLSDLIPLAWCALLCYSAVSIARLLVLRFSPLPERSPAILRFSVLASGSKGNSVYVEDGNVRFLIDAGLGPRTLAARLAGIGRDLADLTAVFLTHEHTDHIRGAGALARKLRVPIYATVGTHAHLKRHLPVGADFRSLQPEDAVRLGAVTVESYPTPHDGDETVAFAVRCGGRKLGHATDLGAVDAVVRDKLRDCDALLVEANHDPAMLESGPYPYFLKQRIGGDWGHLSNAACADLIAGVAHEGLQTVVLMHLSESNNHPDLARGQAARALAGRPVRLLVSRQDRSTPLIPLE